MVHFRFSSQADKYIFGLEEEIRSSIQEEMRTPISAWSCTRILPVKGSFSVPLMLVLLSVSVKGLETVLTVTDVI